MSEDKERLRQLELQMQDIQRQLSERPKEQKNTDLVVAPGADTPQIAYTQGAAESFIGGRPSGSRICRRARSLLGRVLSLLWAWARAFGGAPPTSWRGSFNRTPPAEREPAACLTLFSVIVYKLRHEERWWKAAMWSVFGVAFVFVQVAALYSLAVSSLYPACIYDQDCQA